MDIAAIKAFADAEGAALQSLSTALTNIDAGVKALDDLIIAFQNSPGTLSAADQAMLDNIVAASGALKAQADAINVTPPGSVVPVTPPAVRKP